MNALMYKASQCRIRSLLMLLPGIVIPGFSASPLPLQGEDPPVRDIRLLIEGLGNGYSSPGVTEELIYVTGEKDSLGYLMAFNWEGRKIWKRCFLPVNIRREEVDKCNMLIRIHRRMVV